MGRTPHKALNNPYCMARLQAAAYREGLSTRQGAAGQLHVSESSLLDYELGRCKRVPMDVVLAMAELYDAPALVSGYCAKECPIGRAQAAARPQQLKRLGEQIAQANLALEAARGLLASLGGGAEEWARLEDEMRRVQRAADLADELVLWFRRQRRREE